MIRVYLTDSYIEDNQVKTLVGVESETIITQSISYHYDNDNGTNNVLAIVDGDNAEQFTSFMMPPHDLDDLIADMPEDEITLVITELTNRGIQTSGSLTAGDLLENICKYFNESYVSLGAVLEKDFS